MDKLQSLDRIIGVPFEYSNKVREHIHMYNPNAKFTYYIRDGIRYLDIMGEILVQREPLTINWEDLKEHLEDLNQ